MTKNITPNKINVSLLLSFFYLILLIFGKYYSQGVPFKEFSFLYVGNILNYVPLLIILYSYLLIKFKQAKLSPAVLHTINFLLFIAIAVQVFSITITFIPINFYLPPFNYPAKKILLGISYSTGFAITAFASFSLLYSVLQERYTTALRAIYMTVILFGVYFLFSFSIILFTSVNGKNANELIPKKNGIVLGAAVWNNGKPSTLFNGRILKANHLYRLGKISKIQVTGSNAPGEISEAAAAKKKLLELGVKPGDIIFENKTTTTAEQIRFVKNHYENSKDGVYVISDAFHLRRIKEMAKFFNVKVDGISSNYKLNWRKSIYYYLRESFALLLFWLFAI